MGRRRSQPPYQTQLPSLIPGFRNSSAAAQIKVSPEKTPQTKLNASINELLELLMLFGTEKRVLNSTVKSYNSSQIHSPRPKVHPHSSLNMVKGGE